MWQCSYCPFTSSRKWNMQVHEKRKHQDQISMINGNETRNTSCVSTTYPRTKDSKTVHYMLFIIIIILSLLCLNLSKINKD